MAYKNQHYIPRVYLKNFQNPEIGKLVVYDKKKKETSYCPIKDIFAKEDYFTLHGTEETLRYYGKKVDNKYNNKHCMEYKLHLMESEVGCILKKLKKVKNLDLISQEEVEIIIDWAARIFVITTFINNKIILKLLSCKRIGVLIDHYDQILPFFRNRTWTLELIERQETLFSSDRPIILCDDKSLSKKAGLNNGIIYFSLSPKILLRGTPNKKSRPLIYKNPLILLNEIIFQVNCQTYIKSDNLIIIQEKKDIKEFLNLFLKPSEK